MSAVFGIALLCLAALWLRAALSIYRRPAPPRWANAPLVAELTTVGILAAGVFGFALLAELVATADLRSSVGLAGGILIVAVLAATVVLWRWYRPAAAAVAPAVAPPPERTAA